MKALGTTPKQHDPSMTADGGILKRRTSGRGSLVVTLLVMAIGIVLVGYGAYTITKDVMAVRRYDAAKGSFVESGTEDEVGIDWEALRETNRDVVAWVHVTGTDIDYPVCQANDEDPEYYLHHDLWGNYEIAGCPYLDHRCEPDGAHGMVFGHHMNTGGMFSEIFQCYRQEEFDRVLGGATLEWSTPDSGKITMLPVCAMSVDQTFEDIQWFEFENTTKMSEWLQGLDEQASAHGEGHEALVKTADRIVTLVTCSSMFGGQRERTLVVFAGTL